MEASVNPNTMQKALSELERIGLVHSRRTSGRFITEDETMIKQLKTETATEHIREFLKINGTSWIYQIGNPGTGSRYNEGGKII